MLQYWEYAWKNRNRSGTPEPVEVEKGIPKLSRLSFVLKLILLGLIRLLSVLRFLAHDIPSAYYSFGWWLVFEGAGVRACCASARRSAPPRSGGGLTLDSARRREWKGTGHITRSGPRLRSFPPVVGSQTWQTVEVQIPTMCDF